MIWQDFGLIREGKSLDSLLSISIWVPWRGIESYSKDMHGQKSYKTTHMSVLARETGSCRVFCFTRLSMSVVMVVEEKPSCSTRLFLLFTRGSMWYWKSGLGWSQKQNSHHCGAQQMIQALHTRWIGCTTLRRHHAETTREMLAICNRRTSWLHVWWYYASTITITITTITNVLVCKVPWLFHLPLSVSHPCIVSKVVGSTGWRSIHFSPPRRVPDGLPKQTQALPPRLANHPSFVRPTDENGDSTLAIPPITYLLTWTRFSCNDDAYVRTCGWAAIFSLPIPPPLLSLDAIWNARHVSSAPHQVVFVIW